jgi:hypothetical protein
MHRFKTPKNLSVKYKKTTKYGNIQPVCNPKKDHKATRKHQNRTSRASPASGREEQAPNGAAAPNPKNTHTFTTANTGCSFLFRLCFHHSLAFSLLCLQLCLGLERRSQHSEIFAKFRPASRHFEFPRQMQILPRPSTSAQHLSATFAQPLSGSAAHEQCASSNEMLGDRSPVRKDLWSRWLRLSMRVVAVGILCVGCPTCTPFFGPLPDFRPET